MTVRACEGLPVHARLGVGSTKLPDPRDLRFSYGDSIRLAPSSTVVRSSPGLAAVRLASVRCRTPLMGLSKFRPSID